LTTGTALSTGTAFVTGTALVTWTALDEGGFKGKFLRICLFFLT